MPKDAAYYREYRDRRKTQKRPVPRSSENAERANERRREKRRFKNEFVVWDGEGFDTARKLETDDGSVTYEHIYTLLACRTPDGQYHNLHRNGERLTTDECLAFIERIHYAFPNARHIIFSGQYDIIHILRDLTKEQCDLLTSSSQHRAFYKKYSLKYRVRKELQISWKDGGNAHSVTLWDVFGFYQGSFVGAIKSWIPDAQIDDIIAGKKARNSFSDWNIDDIIAYNNRELELLNELAERLVSAVGALDLTLSRFDGAGAIAKAMYKAHGLNRALFDSFSLTNKGIVENSEDNLSLAAYTAYSGGHIECLKYGHANKKLYTYDIVSAYPAAQHNLPSLIGRWDYHSTLSWQEYDKLPEYALIKVQWKFPDGLHFYPFFYRDTNNIIYYPRQGFCWIHKCEIDAAFSTDYFGKREKRLKLHAAWSFTPSTDQLPFYFIKEAFERRKLLKKEGKNGEQLTLKLGINSCYGVTAQRTTWKNDAGEEKRPAFFNIYYAGIITARTRATIMRAMLQAPESIVAIMTDGIMSEKPLSLDIGSNLGQWEASEIDDVILCQSGFYYVRKGDTWYEKCRGMIKAQTQEEIQERIELIKNAWEREERYLTFPLRFMTPLRQSLTSETLWERRGFFTFDTNGKEVEIRGGGNKRIAETHAKTNKLQETVSFNQEYFYSTMSTPAHMIGVDEDEYLRWKEQAAQELESSDDDD